MSEPVGKQTHQVQQFDQIYLFPIIYKFHSPQRYSPIDNQLHQFPYSTSPHIEESIIKM